MTNYAFTGKAGAGKSTAAEFLADGAGYSQVSIATPLKDVAAQLWGPDARKDRGKLQKLGQFIRELSEDTWVNLLVQKMAANTRSNMGSAKFAVDDLRFPNEYWKLKEERFVIVRVVADRPLRIVRLKNIGKLQDEAQLDDTSETALDDHEADYTVENNGTVDDLFDQLRTVVWRERRRT